jgi:LAS seventeen-binding protein 5
VLDSDSEHEDAPKKEPTSEREMENMRLRMEAQKLEAQRTGELDKLQQRQKIESQRKREKREATRGGSSAYGATALPPPLTPDESPSREDYDMG